MPQTAYIGIGSNLPSFAGSPASTVVAAIESLRSLGAILSHSSLYETAPVDYHDQPRFVNAVVAIRTGLEIERLLESLLAVERSFGRDRVTAVPKGPRTLDLDLLLVVDEAGQGVIYNSGSLTLPHPELANRRFVLAPLAEIAPLEVHPVLGETIGYLLSELPDEGPNSRASIRVLTRDKPDAATI